MTARTRRPITSGMTTLDGRRKQAATRRHIIHLLIPGALRRSPHHRTERSNSERATKLPTRWAIGHQQPRVPFCSPIAPHKDFHRVGTSAATREKSSPPGTEQRGAHVVPRSNRSARLACTVPAVPARSSRRHARACHSGAAAALGRETRISRQGPAGPVQGRRSNRRSRGSRGQADRPGRGPGRARGAPRCWLLAPCVSRPSVRPTGNAELRASLPITRQAPLSIVRCAASEIPQARRLRRLDAVAGKIHHCCQL
jgi:hypothetical protein